MEAVLEKISRREKNIETFSSHGYMPRIYDVQSPCQWLEHCYGGKCPAFVKLNGNFYCSRVNKSFG
jgi:hypothetical protein